MYNKFGGIMVEIDVHGYTRQKASEIIKETIKECYKHGETTIKVIHGSNNGKVIRGWLRNSKQLGDEVLDVHEFIPNPCDITIIRLKLKN